MVESGNTSLALTAVFGAQWLIILALPTVAQLNIDPALGQVSLNRRLILRASELL